MVVLHISSFCKITYRDETMLIDAQASHHQDLSGTSIADVLHSSVIGEDNKLHGIYISDLWHKHKHSFKITRCSSVVSRPKHHG
jgi:hypothetical protein